MTFTETIMNGGYIVRHCEVEKNEFLAMPNDEKIYWLRQVKYIFRIKGLAHFKYLRTVNDNTVIIQNTSSYKKFLLNLDTFEKTPISREEWETKYTNKKENQVKAIEKQIAELQAKLAELRG